MKTIFEKIIDNELNSFKVYEDDNFIAILDIFPKQQGHTILIPKIKKDNILVESDEQLKAMICLAKKLSIKLKLKLNATGIKWIVSSGSSAGQEIYHTHIHLIPHYSKNTKKETNEKILKRIIE